MHINITNTASKNALHFLKLSNPDQIKETVQKAFIHGHHAQSNIPPIARKYLNSEMGIAEKKNVFNPQIRIYNGYQYIFNESGDGYNLITIKSIPKSVSTALKNQTINQ